MTGRARLFEALLWGVIWGCLVFSAAGHLPSLELHRAERTLELGAWHEVVHLSHNAYFAWRVEPLLIALLGHFQASADEALLIINSILSGVFFSGFVWMLSVAGVRRRSSLFGALGSSFLLLYFFGFDLLLNSVLAYLPWISAVLGRFLAESRRRWVHLSLLFLLLLLSGRSAWQFVSLIAAASMCCELGSEESLLRFRLLSKREQLVLALVVLLPVVCFSLSYEIADFPDYPRLSHVVPDDNIPGNIQPHVSTSYPIPVINRPFVRKTYAAPALLLSFAALGAFFSSGGAFRGRFLASFFSALFVVLDTVPPEGIAQIMPLFTLARVLPGFFLFPLAPLFLAFSLFFFAAGMSFARWSHDLLGAGLLLVLTAVVLLGPSQGGPGLGRLWRLDADRAWREAKTRSAVSEREIEDLRRKFVSPSYAVFRTIGPFLFFERGLVEGAEFVSLPAQELKLSASENGKSELLGAMLDDSAETRWSPEKGRQQGNEWVQVELDRARPVRGIELDPGVFSADFPRGLSVLAGEKCTALQHVVNFSDWPGEVRYTPSGFPYYGAQEVVRVVFPEALMVGCLRLEQTAVFPAFDWSVAEIRFLLDHKGHYSENDRK